MNILIRADASVAIGTGHIMRCLTLADELTEQGHQIVFAYEQMPEPLLLSLQEKGYSTLKLPDPCSAEFDQQEDADALISRLDSFPRIDVLLVDHYRLNTVWETALRPYTNQLVVIDDLADRPHNCDILLDQNYYSNGELRYIGLVPESCQLLLGPQYALLRKEFREAHRRKVFYKKNGVKNVLVFFSGSDPTGETIKFLNALENNPLPRNHFFHIIAGSANPLKEQLKLQCARIPGVRYDVQVANMSELLLQSDLCLGAGGTAMWERMVLGVPSITVILADNQRETVTALAHAGAIKNLGWHKDVSGHDMLQAINELSVDHQMLEKMVDTGNKIMGDNLKFPVSKLCRVLNNEDEGDRYGRAWV